MNNIQKNQLFHKNDHLNKDIYCYSIALKACGGAVSINQGELIYNQLNNNDNDI